jgi:hypothetical protein
VEQGPPPCGSQTGAAARRLLIGAQEGAQGAAVKPLDGGALSLVGNAPAGEGTPDSANVSPLTAMAGLSGSRSWKD